MKPIQAAIYRERVEWRSLLIGFAIVLALILAGLIISTTFVNNPDSTLMTNIGSEIIINGESHSNINELLPKEMLTKLLQGDAKDRRLFLVVPMFTSTQSLFLIGVWKGQMHC